MLGVVLPSVAAQASDQAIDRVTASQAIEIHQSQNDKRQYQYLELDNQLRVLLVSDPSTDKAAAALDVEVGSGDDPKERPGLAHFLEHMLFLGTERYPESGEYQTFISEHGGSHNAYTSSEHTNYFFDIDADHLDQALDRFSQFFTAPLFTTEYVDRERNAVHSEYKAKIKDDYRRQYDVLRQLVSSRHPMSKFSVGNLDTLANREGDLVRDDLLDFYQRYYSADRMTLVVLGRESLEQLQAMVVERFAAIEKRDAAKLSEGRALFQSGLLPLRVYIKPEKDIRTLSLVFPIPSSSDYYREKPLQYLGNLLGHEGEGSILSVLKAQGWAEGLSAGGGMGGRNEGTFNISIQLTREGMAQHKKVAALVYKMIRILRREGINQWRYKEQQQLGDIDFRFAEKGEPIHTVSRLASNLQNYAPQDVLRGGYLFAKYDERLIDEYLSYLRPNNALWLVTSKDVKTTKVSPMYQAPYRVEALDDERVSLPKQITEQLVLPEPNGFIPRHLVVKSPPSIGEGISQVPQLIKQDEVQKVWFKQDNTYKIPRAQIYVRLKSPALGRDIKQAVLSELFVALVKDSLNEFSYPASLAGLRFSLSANSRGLDIYIAGYNDRQGLLLSRISEALSDNRFDPARFNNIKDELLRELQNSRKQSPYMQALGELPVALYSPLWTDSEKEKVLLSLTLADVKAFAASFYDDVEQQILIHGNLYRQEALKLAAVLKSRLYRQGDGNKPVEASVVKLANPNSKTPHWHLTVDHPDAMVGLYLQGGEASDQDKAHMLLVRQLMRAPFFHELRTQKQLGYIVFASSMSLKDVAGSVLVVQSPTASVAELQQEISQFLAAQTFDSAALAQNKQAVISNLLEAPKNLMDQSERYWSNIVHEVPGFDRRQKLAKLVEAINEDSLNRYLNELKSPQSRQLWVSASRQSAADVAATLDDIQAFKASSPAYRFP